MMLSSATPLARVSARARPVRARGSAGATTVASSDVSKSRAPEAKSTPASTPTGVARRARAAGPSVLAGVVAAGLAQALAPEPALAVSLRDPVFGDIEVWQFIVLTAGYWWGIEFYLDNKYDKPKPGKVMPKVSAAKKAEVGANKTFAEANAAKEAENEQ